MAGCCLLNHGQAFLFKLTFKVGAWVSKLMGAHGLLARLYCARWEATHSYWSDTNWPPSGHDRLMGELGLQVGL